MGLKDYLNVLRRYMTVIAATTLIGGIAGAVFAFLLPPPPAPVFTASIQGVLLTVQAAEDLQNMVKLGGNFRATTKVLVRIPSPYGALTDQEYSKSRIAFYSDILETEATLDERVKVLSLENSTLAIVSVTDPDGALAEQFAESVASELSRRVTANEAPGVFVEVLGTVVNAPIIPPNASEEALQGAVNRAVRDLITADPGAVAAEPGSVLALFGEAEFTKLSEELSSFRTPEQLRAALSLTSGVPSTTTQIGPVTPEQLGTIAITATDPDAGTADRMVTAAMALLQEQISAESGVLESADSPLVVTGMNTAGDSLVEGGNPTPGRRYGIYIMFGLLFGIAAGIGYALVRASQETTIRTARQVLAFTGEPPIGIISESAGANSDPWMLLLSDPSQEAENYRALRANLMFGLPEAKALAITSAGGGGSAKVGVNLAIALAQVGQSVVLVEADLREPELSLALRLSGSLGLSDVLTGTCSATDAIERWELGGLSVLCAERSATNSSDMLSSETFTTLIDDLRSRFSYVIVTTPPAVDTTDAAVAASRCDGVLILAQYGQSTTMQLEMAVISLLQVGVPIAGVILNEVPQSEVNYWRVASADDLQPSA